jgi:hypothetical protein
VIFTYGEIDKQRPNATVAEVHVQGRQKIKRLSKLHWAVPKTQQNLTNGREGCLSLNIAEPLKDRS